MLDAVVVVGVVDVPVVDTGAAAESVAIVEAESPDVTDPDIADVVSVEVVVAVEVSDSVFCDEQAVASATIDKAKKADFATVFIMSLENYVFKSSGFILYTLDKKR